MSDPASNVNIEDVLTSIRRLVSTARPAAPEDGGHKAPERRFVLTEAHRVEAEPRIPVGAAAAEPVLALETAGDADEPALVLRDPAPAAPKGEVSATAAQMETALNAQDHEFEPDGSEVKPDEAWHEVADVPFVHARGAASTAAVLADRATRDDDLEVEISSDPEAALREETDNIEFRRAETEAEDSPSEAPVAETPLVEEPPEAVGQGALFDSVRTPPAPEKLNGLQSGLTLSVPAHASDIGAEEAAEEIDEVSAEETANLDAEISETEMSSEAPDVPEQEELEAELAAVEATAQDDPVVDEAQAAGFAGLEGIAPLEPLPPLPPLSLNRNAAPEPADAEEGEAPEAAPDLALPETLEAESLEAQTLLPDGVADEVESEASQPDAEDDPWSSESLEAASESAAEARLLSADGEKTRPPRFTDDTRLRRIVFEAEERAAEVFEPEIHSADGELDEADDAISSEPGYELAAGAEAGASALAFDEEELRELVSDLVREELRGALGERITGNVRKLVRREIHRVLASYEFDT